MGSVGAVIVHFGDRARTRWTVESISGMPVVGHVVVVDHGPRAVSPGDDVLAPAEGKVDVLDRSDDNAGFAAGVALGLERLGDEAYVLLLNPDATLDHTALATMAEVLDGDPRAVAVSPTLVVDDGRVWYAGGHVDRWRGLAVHDRFGDPAAPPPGPPVEVGYLPLTAVLVRRSALAEVGGVPLGWFLYWEDVELCSRLTAAGWRLMWTPAAVAVHERGRHGDPLRNLSATMLELDTRNRLWWIRLRLTGLRRATALAWTLPLTARRIWLIQRAGGGAPRWRALARGLSAGLRQQPPGG